MCIRDSIQIVHGDGKFTLQNGETVTFAAVSYTHLDVYKRQPVMLRIHRSISILLFSPEITRTLGRVIERCV